MERSKKLHNFDFPPGLVWGRQQVLRCMKVDPDPVMHADKDDESSDSGEDNPNPSAGQPRSTDDRQKKLEFELNSSSSPIKAFSSPNESEEDSPPLKYKSLKKLTSKASLVSSPPAVHSKDRAKGGINVEADGQKPEKKTRPRRNLEKKEERPKFSIQLSRKQIEEDFIAMTGKKPPRKPKKHPKSVQMKIDALTPGSWLSEVHPDRYKVNENGKI